MSSYGQFCPVAKACEILEPRWTVLILMVILGGTSRFNEIRRGVPGVSPTLLAKRLRDLEAQNLVERVADRANGAIDYVPTKAAVQLDPIIDALGRWAHRNIDGDVTLQHLDARLLMWNIRRKLNAAALPQRRTVIRFDYVDAKQSERIYWLIVTPRAPVELCFTDPRFDVDLYVEASLRALTSYWIGYSSLSSEIANDRIRLIGDQLLIRTIDKWLVRSSFAEAC